MLPLDEIKSRAIEFQKRWKNSEGNERQDAQTFEKDFMHVFGVDFREGLHEHQIYLKDGGVNYIDYLLPQKILIEMKSKGQSLDRAFSQAMSYFRELSPEEQPELIMVCDFNKIKVYNIKKDRHYKTIKVSQLKQHITIFTILAGYKEDLHQIEEIEVNTNASYKMAKLHDELKNNGYQGHELEIYLVRLLFCLFADDTGIFEKDIFLNYIKNSKDDGSDLSSRISELFFILDTPHNKRMKNISPELDKFRYINGKLFTEKLPPASFDKNMRQTLIDCCNFDWNKISPAIFGAMFQSVMDQDKRRELGAHYTSEENILKVINPLFLEDLEQEFEKSVRSTKELDKFHNKLASLKFLDPACGSGNFLLVAYQQLRLLEAKVMKILYGEGSSLFNFHTKVHIDQFYGIEYEEFPCEVAKVSMILMKHLLDQSIGEEFGINLVDFPIKESSNIINANALRINWEDITNGYVDYIFGNPPYVGTYLLNKEQIEDKKIVFDKYSNQLDQNDYICNWFYKAKLLLDKNLTIKVAFVSTNSICQGSQVSSFWKLMMQDNNIFINFAYKTFVWSNEAKFKAGVHCIIVGFSNKQYSKNLLVDSDGNKNKVSFINPYLDSYQTIFVDKRKQPLSFTSNMSLGSTPIDDSNFIITDKEKEELIKKYPFTVDWIRPFIGAKEFINRTSRNVLWLKYADPHMLRKVPFISERLNNITNFRKQSTRKSTLAKVNYPTLFASILQPESGNYLIVPRVSSKNRYYIPIGYESYHTIASDAVYIVPNADLLTFALVTSQAHMVWMRAFAGRLKSDYRYSRDFVYNTFPIPQFDEKTKQKLESTAQAIIDARKLYANCTYADLYDDHTMPIELRKAHQKNDEAVRKAYGNVWKKNDEDACLKELIKLYQKYINQ